MSTHDQYRPEWACLNVPPLAGAAVRRHSLLDVLSDIRCRVVWIAAPPGYGKTSLLAQHADLTKARGEAVSWLSVEQSDADAHRLAANLSLSLALSNTAPRAAEGWRASEPELLLTEALAAVAASAQPQTLYLDDCHLAADAPALALIGTLLRRAPANLRIVATARGQPAIPLVDLELQGLLRRLGESDIRFTAEETRSYLCVPVAASTLAALLEKSRGWPIALQLARTQLQRGGTGELESEMLSGTDVMLGRYFNELVLSRVPTPLKEFLADTAVLDRVNGDIANAIRESSDGWSLLEEIESRGLFVTPCDADGEWFQYHPMFREYLAHRARRMDPQREKVLRRRAALWLARHEAWPEAIQQAMRSGDIDLAAQIVDRTNHLEVMMRFGGAVLSGLDQLPDEHLARYPRLALCVAYAHFQEGRLAHVRRLLDAIPQPAAQVATSSEDCTEVAQRNVFEALLEVCDDHAISKRIEQIEAYLARGAVDDPVVRGQCYVVWIVDRQDHDDPTGALLLSDRLIQETQNAHTPYLDGFGWVLRGMAHMARAELASAQQCYVQCLQLGEKYFGRTATHTPIAEITLADVLYERDRCAEAAIPLERGLLRIDSIYGWYEMWEPTILAAPPILAHVHGVERALTFLHQSQSRAQTQGLERANMLCDAALVSMMLRSGQTGEAARIFECSKLPDLLGRQMERRTARVFTHALLAGHDLAMAQGDAGRWVETMTTHIQYLRQQGLRRRLLLMLLARAASTERLGDDATASASLCEALLLGVSRGFVRVFLERAGELTRTVARVAAEPFDATSEAEVRTMLASMRERSGVLSAPAESALLSPREAQVLRMMPEGLTSKEIAQRLGVTHNTVKGYRRTLFEKLGVTSRSRAIEKARRLQLLS